MSLLRWMGVTHHPPVQQNLQETQPKPVAISPPDAKRYGLENVGNICYANSVIQALYFCGPFRELVCLAPDRSHLFPTSTPPVQISVATAGALQSGTTSASAVVPKQTKDSKGPSGSKRPLSSAALERERDARQPGTEPGTAGADAGGNASTTPAIPTNPPTLFSALRSLFLHISLHMQDKGTVVPTAFINKLKKENELFRSTMHQDAHEFLNYLLNKIMEDIALEEKEAASEAKTAAATTATRDNGTGNGDDLTQSAPSLQAGSTSRSVQSTSNRTTLVQRLFEGTLTNETRCLTCENVSSRDETFLDLSLDIEKNSSVTACLRQFSASEMLCQRNKFFCDSCASLQEAEKRMKIKTLPNVLALHLKRFKYQEDLQKYIKLTYRVAFPFELRLFNTVDDVVDPDRLYELFAIVVHIGGGPHHGHYITIIKAQGTWFSFDDDTVEPIKEAEIHKFFGESSSGAGYVLFYQAVDLDREALGLPPLPIPVDSSTPVTVAQLQEQAAAVIQTTLNDQPAASTKTASNIDIPSTDGEVLPSVPTPVPVSGTGMSLPPSPTTNTFHTAGQKSDAQLTSSPGQIPVSPDTPSVPTVPLPGPLSPPPTAGLFFKKSLRNSTSSRTGVPGLPSSPPPSSSGRLHDETNGASTSKDDKEKTGVGWLSFRSKEKRRGSIGNSASINAKLDPLNLPPVPVSPRLHTSASSPRLPLMSPPSPGSGPSRHNRRPSTSGTSEKIPPIPVADLLQPLPPLPSPLPHPKSPRAQLNGWPQRSFTADTTTMDGSESPSGSSSWTSLGPSGAMGLTTDKDLTQLQIPSSPSKSDGIASASTPTPTANGESSARITPTSATSQGFTPLRTLKKSIGGGKESKARKAAEKAREHVAAEEQWVKLEAERVAATKEPEKEKEKEKERERDKEEEKKLRRASSRKMSLSSIPGMRIPAFGRSKDKDKEKEKEKEREREQHHLASAPAYHHYKVPKSAGNQGHSNGTDNPVLLPNALQATAPRINF